MGVVHLLVSPDGGRGRARAAAAAVRSVVRAAGHDIADISGNSAAASEEAARAAAADGAERLVAVGGDGIIHIALQGVAGSDAVLGIVPAGTGNDFARALGLSGVSVEQAAARALGPGRPVDAIRTERAWTASVVTGGFSVDVNNRADRLRFPRGSSRYTAATLLTVPRLRHRRLAFTIDGRRREFTTALWAVANTPTFGGGMAVCPDADARDGLLDLTVVGDLGRATLLRLLPAVFKGAHVAHPKVHTGRGQVITVEGADAAGATAETKETGSPGTGSPGTGSPGTGSARTGSPPGAGAAFARDGLLGDGEPLGAVPATFTAVAGAFLVAADP